MRYITLFFIVLATVSGLSAQIQKPVKWKLDTEKVNGKEYDLVFTATINDGWHVYSQHIEGDDGPVPTSINFEGIKGFEILGKAKELGELHKEFSNIFDMNLSFFKKKVTFKQRIRLKGSYAKTTGYLEYMTCDNEMCLPPTPVEFSFDIGEKKDPVSISPVKSKPEPVKLPPQTSTPKPQPKPTPVAEKPKPKTGSLFPSKTKTTSTSSSTHSAKTTKTTSKPKLEEPKEEEPIAQADIETTTPDVFDDAGGFMKMNEGEQDGFFKPVTWNFKAKHVSDTEVDLIFDADIEKGWSVYSQFLESDEGPVATSFEIEAPENNKPVGKAEEAGDKSSGFDKVFGMNLTKFKDKYTITQRLKVPEGTKDIKGYVNFMTCNDERCLPPTDAYFDLKFPAAGGETSATEAGATGDGGMPTAEFGAITKSDRFSEPLAECGERKAFTNLWMIFLLGFLGGLVALLTPCVFPMIPLTVGYFTKQSKTKAKGITNALIYGISIIVIYVALGMSLPIIFGPDIMNSLATNAIVNLIFFVLFVIFAFSFFGYFEITLPHSWSSKTDQLADKGGYLGIFFMAFTLGIVSFSCTGPIIGTLLVEAATGGGPQIGRLILGPPIGMLGFSLALALPFTLFAAFPGWLNSLPKSGGWMVSVKVVLGFLELALALKFLSLVDLAYHWNFLKYEIFMALWILIFFLMALYLFGFISFPHDSPIKKLSKVRFMLGLLSFAFAVYMCTGLVYNKEYRSYNSLSLLSGLAPPGHYTLLHDPGECPVGLNCFKDYEEGLAFAKKEKKAIFVDFTGHGCVNCRKMEETVWPLPEIRKRLAEEFVLISLYVDDRKKLKQSYISDVDGQKKRTIGNKWADFQAKHFGKNSQPYYVLLSHDEKLLNIPVGYTPNKDEFSAFLDCGLNAYYKDCPTCKKQ